MHDARLLFHASMAVVLHVSAADPSLADQVSSLQEQVRSLQEQNRALQQHAAGAMLSVDDTGTSLLQKRYLYRVDRDGNFAVPSRLHRFSLDVGFNVGLVMIDDWFVHQRARNMFMIGIEANPYLHAAFDIMTTALPFPRGFEGLFWHAGDSIAATTPTQAKWAFWVNATVHRARVFKAHSDQMLLIHAAASSSMRGVADFHLGSMGARGIVPDVGSLYSSSFETSEDKVVHPVAILRLGDVLARVPPPPRLVWDTLKIDIQGADADALLSAREHLPNFLCVIGEFSGRFYKVPKGTELDPAALLTGAGFRLARRDNHGQLWINLRFRHVFESYQPGESANFTCTANVPNRRGAIPGKLTQASVAASVRELPR